MIMIARVPKDNMIIIKIIMMRHHLKSRNALEEDSRKGKLYATSLIKFIPNKESLLNLYLTTIN